MLAAAVVICGGCAGRDESRGADPAAPDRVANLTILRVGQPYLGGTLEVTRFRKDRRDGTLWLALGVTNRSGSAQLLRWRFRYVDADGWERRTRDSAEWKHEAIGTGEEWTWEGEAEVKDAVEAGMDWRLEP